MKIFTLLFFVTLTNIATLHEKTQQDSEEIPFELIKNKPIISVEIQGKKFRFLIDTGGIFEISEAIQKVFSFDELASTLISDINQNEVSVKMVKVPKVSIGNFIFKDKPAIVSDLTGKYPYSCFGLDGMIGRDFFKDKILQFNLKKGVFRIAEDISLFKLDAASKTKMKLSRRGLPDILLKINGKKDYVEFDSGSGDFYSPKKSEVAKHKNTDGMITLEGFFSFGITMNATQTTQRYIQKIQSLELAGSRFEQFYSNQSKITEARIGSGILHYGTVTLDYQKNWFYFETYSNRGLPDFSSFGFDIAKLNDQYVVKWVIKNSVAEKNGLQTMTKIISINEIPIADIANGCEGYLKGYRYKKENKILVKYIDQSGKLKEVVLQKKVY